MSTPLKQIAYVFHRIKATLPIYCFLTVVNKVNSKKVNNVKAIEGYKKKWFEVGLVIKIGGLVKFYVLDFKEKM